MIGFTANISGDKDLERRFSDAGSIVRTRVKELLTEAGQQIKADAQASVPQRTGKLRAKIKTSIKETDRYVSARVAPYRYYAAMVEGGVHAASVQVHGYVRQQQSRNVRALALTKSGRMSRKKVAAGVVFVKPYQRSFHIEAHPYMRPAFDKVKDRVVDEINGIVLMSVGGES